MRHYDQRPFDETVCDAIIANGGVKKSQKGAKRLRWTMHQTFRSPSSPEEDPPKTNSVEKGYDPYYKTYVSVIVLGDKTEYIYQKYSCSLTARWRAGPLAGTVR